MQTEGKLQTVYRFASNIKRQGASPLRTIFASLSRENEHVNVHNERNFPQAKLDSEINVPCILNEHGDLHFYLIIIVYILSSLI